MQCTWIVQLQVTGSAGTTPWDQARILVPWSTYLRFNSFLVNFLSLNMEEMTRFIVKDTRGASMKGMCTC